MTPTVSVVVETINPRENKPRSALVDELAPTLAALAQQTCGERLIETIVVVDEQVEAATVDALRRRHPEVTLVIAAQRNYCAHKNAGAARARGSIVAFVDGDCVAAPDWLAALLARFTPGVDVVAGRSRYPGRSFLARTFSVPDFAYVLAAAPDAATGFNLSNVAIRRELLLAHPLDERIRRNGGCYLLFHELRAAGARIVYEPGAMVAHGLDFSGLGFVGKHFARGHDGANVYRLDDRGVLRGTGLFRRLGPLALVAITGRRLLLDWGRLVRHRRQVGIPVWTLPYYAALGCLTRLIELAGGLKATVRPGSRP